MARIRLARAADLPALAPLVDESNALHARIAPRLFQEADGAGEAWLRTVGEQADHAILVAEERGDLVGLVVVEVEPPPDVPILVPRTRGIVHELVVTASLRRSGLGRRLMEAAHAWARDRGAQRIELNVVAGNEAARGLYAAMGYEPLLFRLGREVGDLPRVRPLEDSDSIAALTALLHRAYAPLAALGMRYVASHQSEEVTRERIARGECWVLEDGGRLVGTATLHPPGSGLGGGSWYSRAEVAVFGQYAVDPDRQGEGLGARLLDRIEARAAELGAEEIACDTSVHAGRLIATYRRRGYRQVGTEDWRPVVNYTSVVLSKALGRG